MRYPDGHQNCSDELPSSAYRRRAFGPLLEESQVRIDLLGKDPHSPAARIADKLHSCCSHPQIISLNDGERYYLTESRCRSRLCPRCAKIRAKMLAQRIATIVHHMDDPRFLTLSCRSRDGSLRDGLKFLRRRFATLRRTPLWQCLVRGGIYTVEITFNRETEQWHPHLHAIIDGKYIPHSDLLEIWSQILHDSGSVHITKVHGIRKVSNYLAAYVSKSCDLSKLPPNQLVEWAIETHSLRLAQTFGCYHANQPAQDKLIVTSYRLLPVDVNKLAYKAECGDSKCSDVLAALSGSSPCDRPDFMFMVARAIPPPPIVPRVIKVKPIDQQISFRSTSSWLSS